MGPTGEWAVQGQTPQSSVLVSRHQPRSTPSPRLLPEGQRRRRYEIVIQKSGPERTPPPRLCLLEVKAHELHNQGGEVSPSVGRSWV